LLPPCSFPCAEEAGEESEEEEGVPGLVDGPVPYTERPAPAGSKMELAKIDLGRYYPDSRKIGFDIRHLGG